MLFVLKLESITYTNHEYNSQISILNSRRGRRDDLYRLCDH